MMARPGCWEEVEAEKSVLERSGGKEGRRERRGGERRGGKEGRKLLA
jgi:hypothetical protein